MTDGASFRGEHLRRVVLVPDGAWLEGWKVQSVELYGDGVIVRAWAAGESRRMSEAGDDPVLWTLHDDVDTRYTLVGDGASWDDRRAVIESEFVPAVPANATVLTLAGERESVQVKLSETAP